MPLTPDEETALFAKWSAEHKASSMTEEEKAAAAERESTLDSIADRVVAKLKGDSGNGPPQGEKKPQSGHSFERTLFGKKA